MKNKVLYVFISLFSIISCSENNSNEKLVSDKKSEKLTIEQPSELAALMKAMKHQSTNIKEAVEKGDSLDFAMLEDWKKIHSAEPTQKDKKTPIYHGFASVFLSSVDSFKLKENNRVVYFNAMITACVDCHKEVCPGPVSTIQKLKIK